VAKDVAYYGPNQKVLAQKTAAQIQAAIKNLEIARQHRWNAAKMGPKFNKAFKKSATKNYLVAQAHAEREFLKNPRKGWKGPGPGSDPRDW
jgi:hypothetical protein